MKHTPGPWKAKVPGAGVYDPPPFWIEADRQYRIADICWHGDSTEANARLIAAAPEMLEACKNARECLAQGGIVGRSERIAELNAAIARAEGE